MFRYTERKPMSGPVCTAEDLALCSAMANNLCVDMAASEPVYDLP
jgi:hypothetical protein